MKLWKSNQYVYNQLQQDFTDSMDKMNYVETGDKVAGALKYLLTDDDLLEYPGKSYAVAIIYARLLKDHFEEDFYEVLNDPELLYGNDPYFTPYSEDSETYDTILDTLGGYANIPLEGKWIDHTVKYFREECLGENIFFDQ